MVEKAKILRSSNDLDQMRIDEPLKVIGELQITLRREQEGKKVRMWPVDGGQLARIWGPVALVSSQVPGFLEAIRKGLGTG